MTPRHPDIRKEKLWNICEAHTWLPLLTILVIAGCTYVMFLDLLYVGDDVFYGTWMKSRGATFMGYPILMHRHWEIANSRMADMLSPIFMEAMPAVPRAAVNAIFTGLLYLFLLVLAGFRRSLLLFRTLLIFLIAFTLPWDALWTQYITQTNYVWGMALPLGVLIIILKTNPKRNSLWLWLLLPFALIAGWTHESIGLPLALGLAAWMFASGFAKRASGPMIAIALAFMAGGLMSVTSQASYSRAASDFVGKSYISIIPGSAYYFLLLAAVTICLAIWARPFLRRLCRTSWLIFAIASVPSFGFLIVSGFGGRPGWATQVFSLLSLAMMVAESGWQVRSRTLSAILSAILSATVMVHFVASARIQADLNVEANEIIAAVKASDSPLIFKDYTHDRDLPWWTMKKLRTFPDADDVYDIHMLGRIYRPDPKRPLFILLPEAARDIDFAAITGPVRVSGSIISPAPLPGKVTRVLTMKNVNRVLDIDGTEMIEWPFLKQGRKLYFYTPLEIDPGQN